MTEIDVPDWVVEVAMAAGEKFASENTVSMYATVRDLRREEMRTSIAAALGAWVVPVGCIESHELSEMAANRKSSYDLWNLRTYEPDDTILYTLRQEKPE